MWHKDEPIGICVFTTPPLMLKSRRQFFGLSGKWTSLAAKALNQKVCMLSRVVLHPAYRGAGIASQFIHRSCQLTPWPWIETLTQLGHITPVFESAGFQRIGLASPPKNRSHSAHAAIYGCKPDTRQQLSQESHQKSRFTQPVYYIFDNQNNISS